MSIIQSRKELCILYGWWIVLFSVLRIHAHFWKDLCGCCNSWSSVFFCALCLLWFWVLIRGSYISSMTHLFLSLRWCWIFLFSFVYLFVFSIGRISRSTCCNFALSDLIKIMSSTYLGLKITLWASLLITQLRAGQRIWCLLSCCSIWSGSNADKHSPCVIPVFINISPPFIFSSLTFSTMPCITMCICVIHTRWRSLLNIQTVCFGLLSQWFLTCLVI